MTESTCAPGAEKRSILPSVRLRQQGKQKPQGKKGIFFDYQTNLLKETLNRKGGEGWELIQLAFGTDGIVAFWKRVKDE
jgi:hypothetical protein